MARPGKNKVLIDAEGLIESDRTPSDILTALLELYPKVGELWVDCYYDADALKGIITRGELLWDLFEMAEMVGIITKEEKDKMCRSFGARPKEQ